MSLCAVKTWLSKVALFTQLQDIESSQYQQLDFRCPFMNKSHKLPPPLVRRVIASQADVERTKYFRFSLGSVLRDKNRQS